jgi:hypothetical protein
MFRSIKDEPWFILYQNGTVRAFRQKFTLDDAIGFHAFAPLARLKLLHACDQWHSSSVLTPLTGSHCKFRPNTEGELHKDPQAAEAKARAEAGMPPGMFDELMAEPDVDDHMVDARNSVPKLKLNPNSNQVTAFVVDLLVFHGPAPAPCAYPQP